MIVNQFSSTNTDKNHSLSVAFVHNKGGTGKTTACLNIAGWLAKMSQKILVVDLDPQANATSGLGVDLKSLQHSMYDVLLADVPLTNIILETRSGLYLAPATANLLTAEIELASTAHSANLLNKKMRGMEDFFDFILIDCPPGSTLLMMNGILASKNLIIPLDSGIFGFETLETLKTLILNLEEEFDVKINILMALLKIFSPSLLDKLFTKNIRDMISYYFIKHGLKNCPIRNVPFSAKICKAQISGLPISHYAPMSKVSKVYRQISTDILQWGNGLN